MPGLYSAAVTSRNVPAAVVFLCLFAHGCVLEPVETSGLECPCGPGWRCETSTNVCVRGGEGECGRAGRELGSVVLTNLRVDWVTANQARIAWEAESLEDLFAYEVDIAPTEEAILAGEPTRTVTSDENPELARSFLVGAASADPVLATTLFGLEAGERYRVRLVAEDGSGRVTCSEIIGLLTNPPPALGFSMADESRGSAVPNPPCITFATSSDRASSGERYWEWTAQCERAFDAMIGEYGEPVCEIPDPEHPTCWENLRIESLDYPLSLNASEFQLAFLEMSVAVESAEHGYWAEMGISTPGDGASDFFVVGRQTVAANVGYRRYQVPLRILRGSTGQLTADAVNRGIRSYRIGTHWKHGAVVRIDGAAIRW